MYRATFCQTCQQHVGQVNGVSFVFLVTDITQHNKTKQNKTTKGNKTTPKTGS